MLSGIITTFLMLLFIGLWVWAWQPRLRQQFDATARLAVDDTVPAGEERADHEQRGSA